MQFDDMELMQLQFCMSQTKKMMSMGGEIRRHASITQKIEEEMDRRKNATGAYTREGILRQLDEEISQLEAKAPDYGVGK
jgi:predicted  nucleic acid-binding Zn-ribbon protein